MWDKITVGQFQAIYKVSIDTQMDEADKASNIISILYNLSLAQVDDLTVSKFNELSKASAMALNIESMPGKPMRKIKAAGKKYAVIYDPAKMRHRQYVEAMHFSDKHIENMHMIMASIVEPVTWYSRRLRNEGVMHKRIASDMLQARVIDVCHSCVFFCKLYLNSIKSLEPYLISQMMKKGVTKEAAKEALNFSQSILAGYILPEKLQPLKG